MNALQNTKKQRIQTLVWPSKLRGTVPEMGERDKMTASKEIVVMFGGISVHPLVWICGYIKS